MRIRPGSAVVAAFTAAALVCPGYLRADDPYARGVDPVSFKLAPGDAFGTVESAQVMPLGHYRLDLAVDGAFGLLALRSGDEKVGDLLGPRLDLHLLLSIGLARGFELAADLPVTVYQRHGFAIFEDRGMDLMAPAAGGTGDIRLTGKFALPLRNDSAGSSAMPRRGVWRASLLAELRLPTGDEQSFLGERSFMFSPRAVVCWDGPSGWRLAGTAGYRWRREAGRFLNLYVGDELHAGFAAARALPPIFGFAGWDVFGELLLATPARAPFALNSPAYKTPLEALGGLRFALPGGLEAKLMAGTGLAMESGFGRTGLRLAATFGWAWPARPSERLPAMPPSPEPLVDEPPTVEKLVGVPEGPPWALFDGGRIELRGAVRFDTGKATLRPESLPVLDEIADLLELHSEIRQVRIDGHTDSQGSAAFNLTLSKQRAQTVVDYLIARGVAEQRLSFTGFGQTAPIDTNATPSGRSRNRRVELTILELE